MGIMEDISAHEIEKKNGKTMIEMKKAEKLAEYNGYAKMVKKMTHFQTVTPSTTDTLLWRAMFKDSEKKSLNQMIKKDDTINPDDKKEEKIILSKETKTDSNPKTEAAPKPE